MVFVGEIRRQLRFFVHFNLFFLSIGLPSLCGSSEGGSGRARRVQEGCCQGRIGYQPTMSTPGTRSHQSIGGRERWQCECHDGEGAPASPASRGLASKEDPAPRCFGDGGSGCYPAPADDQHSSRRCGTTMNKCEKFPLLEGTAMHLRGGGKGKGRKILLDGRPFTYVPKSIGAGHSTKSNEAKMWNANREGINKLRRKVHSLGPGHYYDGAVCQ